MEGKEEVRAVTRKRFVKLQMAKGRSRNSANEIASMVQREGLSYRTASSLPGPKSFSSIIGAFSDAFKALGAAASALSEFCGDLHG